MAGLGLLALLNGSDGFGACTGFLGWGWVVPLFAGFVIAGVLWFLSGETPKYTGAEELERPGERGCSTCGGPVMSSWRLCPRCGSWLED